MKFTRAKHLSFSQGTHHFLKEQNCFVLPSLTVSVVKSQEVLFQG